MIWLFPSSIPITSQNIVHAILTADKVLPGSPVRLFTGVPYIQKICLEDAECLQALKKMDIVGYGGAQLPETIGSALVENGVNLVSRFGSTECGCELNYVLGVPDETNRYSSDELIPRFQQR
jgi:hypothetical protein